MTDFLNIVIPEVENIKPGDTGALHDALLNLNEFVNVSNIFLTL